MIFFEGRLETLLGDITKLDCEGIVNAANSSLMGGGGVDGAIHRAAGPSLLEACKSIRKTAYPDGLPAGEAVASHGGDLSCRRVIHTVGPVWQGGMKREAELLAGCYRKSLALAREEGLRTLAFPAVSTGVYAYPRELAAPVVYGVMQEELAKYALPEKVFLVFFSAEAQEVFLTAVSKIETSGLSLDGVSRR